MAEYKVLAGLSYASKRVEAGATANDIPSKSVPWLLEQNLIEPLTTPKKREPVSEDEGDN
jgi:hypothetical protein